MREFMKRILNPDIQLRDRLYQLLSTIALAEFILVSLYTMVTGGRLLHVAVMIAGTCIFAMMVAFTFRTGHMRIGATVTGLLYYLIYPLTFFSSGGMYGGAPPVFAFALIYVFLVTQRWERVMAMAFCVCCSAACYLAAFLHPELLVRHTVPMEHIESFLSVLLVVLLLCMLFTFVTEVYQAENRIVQRQKAEIERLHESQKQFFSSMSHEIRTPVNAILGCNEMTLKEDVSEEVRENSQNIEVASRILLHTINEILDMSRLETGQMKIHENDYNVISMISDIEGMIRPRAQSKGLEFVVRIDPQMPKTLHGDEMRIRQVLLNICTNAVKYTREGSVTLTVTGRQDGDGFLSVYDVTDTGIGIRTEAIPHLFTAFQREDEQANHAIEGTGLGLTIVKAFLDMMEGEVSVTSEYGKGTTFHVEIPQGVVDEMVGGGKCVENEVVGGEKGVVDEAAGDEKRVVDEAAGDEKTLRGRFAHLHILVVDDTPMNLLVVKKLLRNTEADVDTAVSGEEALMKTGQKHYDLILMDHQMPEMDGTECLQRIRQQEDGQCQSSKVVCLTANVGVGMAEEYKSQGFDGYLEKPVRGWVLEEEIARLTEGI